ncbi:hypothetical protein D3C87_1471110 [compost metagenome]
MTGQIGDIIIAFGVNGYAKGLGKCRFQAVSINRLPDSSACNCSYHTCIYRYFPDPVILSVGHQYITVGINCQPRGVCKTHTWPYPIAVTCSAISPDGCYQSVCCNFPDSMIIVIGYIDVAVKVCSNSNRAIKPCSGSYTIQKAC